MTNAAHQQPRDCASAVVERHYWRAVDRCVSVASAPAPASAPVSTSADGLPVWTVEGLRSAGAQEQQRADARARMYRYGALAQRAGSRWQHHAAQTTSSALSVSLERVQVRRCVAQTALATLTYNPLRRPQTLPLLEHEHADLSRRSNAPNLPAQISTSNGARPT